MIRPVSACQSQGTDVVVYRPRRAATGAVNTGDIMGKAGWVALGVLLSSQSTVALARNKEAEPVPLVSPATWFDEDSYPPEALRAGAQGRAVVRLTIDEHGTPSQCYVAVSAGNAALDTGTCNLAMTHGRFTPARDAQGNPRPSTYLLPVRWVLPEDVPEVDLGGGRHVFADQIVKLSLDETGAVTACKTVKNAVSILDPCSAYPKDVRPFGAPTRGGKPIPATVTMTSQVYMDGD